MKRLQSRIGITLITASAFSFMSFTLASAQDNRKNLVIAPTGTQVRVCAQKLRTSVFTGGKLSRTERLEMRLQFRRCVHQARMLNNGYTSSSSKQLSSPRSSSRSMSNSYSSSRSKSSSSSNNSQTSSSSSISSSEHANQSAVSLGAASTFAVLAGSTVTNTGPTTVTGDLGVSAGSAVTGFLPGVVTGGTIHAADTFAGQAQLALTVAYNNLAGRSTAPVSVEGNLGGMTLAPGLYKSTTSLEISSGDLTLDAKGDSNAIFIFQIASTLHLTTGRSVLLIGGAKAANIYWQVGTSATLEANSVFKGSILADQSISLQTGATVDGRLLARIGAVTLQGNTVTIPVN